MWRKHVWIVNIYVSEELGSQVNLTKIDTICLAVPVIVIVMPEFQSIIIVFWMVDFTHCFHILMSKRLLVCIDTFDNSYW